MNGVDIYLVVCEGICVHSISWTTKETSSRVPGVGTSTSFSICLTYVAEENVGGQIWMMDTMYRWCRELACPFGIADGS